MRFFPLDAPAASGVVALLKGVDFSQANHDNPVPVQLPPELGRYMVSSVRISNASEPGGLPGATVGLYTAPAAGGVALITAATAVTITSNADGVANNAQTIAATNATTRAHTLAGNPLLYFRTIAAAPGTADVVIALVPVG